MNLLHKIQQELKAPKSQYNDFAKYNYRSCEDILEAVKPLLKDEGTLIISDEIVNIGTHNYVKATAKLQQDKMVWEATAYARESESKKGMDDSQMTGTASSYARKYALNGLFAIDDTKDADTKDNREKKERTIESIGEENARKKFEKIESQGKEICAECGVNEVTGKVLSYSKSKLGKAVCYSCQQNR